MCRSAHQPAAQLIRTLSLRLAAMHACCSALVTDRYASDRSVYLPTMAMVTGWGSGVGGGSKGEGTHREQHHGVWEPYQSWCTHQQTLPACLPMFPNAAQTHPLPHSASQSPACPTSPQCAAATWTCRCVPHRPGPAAGTAPHVHPGERHQGVRMGGWVSSRPQQPTRPGWCQACKPQASAVCIALPCPTPPPHLRLHHERHAPDVGHIVHRQHLVRRHVAEGGLQGIVARQGFPAVDQQ